MSSVDELIAYFERERDLHPLDDRWQQALDLIAEWQRIARTNPVAPPDIAALLEVCRSNRHHGSGWYDLAIRIHNWPLACGYDSDLFLWRLR